jgi:hypothetical protein
MTPPALAPSFRRSGIAEMLGMNYLVDLLLILPRLVEIVEPVGMTLAQRTHVKQLGLRRKQVSECKPGNHCHQAQRPVDSSPCFVLRNGTYRASRLGLRARAARDHGSRLQHKEPQHP